MRGPKSGPLWLLCSSCCSGSRRQDAAICPLWLEALGYSFLYLLFLHSKPASSLKLYNISPFPDYSYYYTWTFLLTLNISHFGTFCHWKPQSRFRNRSGGAPFHGWGDRQGSICPKSQGEHQSSHLQWKSHTDTYWSTVNSVINFPSPYAI